MPAAHHYFSGAVAIVAALSAGSPARAQQGTIYYSGTVSWAGEWKISNPNTHGSGGEKVTVTIDSGAAQSAVRVPTRVSCSGNGWAQGAETEEWTISGRGMVDIVTVPDGSTPRSRTYQITVTCDGEPEGSVRGANMFIESSTPDLMVLEGSQTYDHPQTDEVNGVTGTMKVNWRLRSGPRDVRAVPGGRR